jgi:MerR family transcriptional regulator, copper efflux regulator
VNIGKLADLSGVSSKLIRYYESIGLIPAAERTDSNYRIYRSEDVHFLRFIKRARKLGFGISDIQLLLSLWQDKSRSSAEVKDLAQKHIQNLESQMAEIQIMLNTLKQLAHICQGDDRPDCPILDGLAQDS